MESESRSNSYDPKGKVGLAAEQKLDDATRSYSQEQGLQTPVSSVLNAPPLCALWEKTGLSGLPGCTALLPGCCTMAWMSAGPLS